MASKPQRWSDITDRTVGWSDSASGEILSRSRRLWKVLEYSSAYLALIAVAEVLIVMLLLSLPLSVAPLVVGLLTFAIYANDRLVDLESDTTSSPERTAFVRRYRRELYVLAALSYGLAVTLSVAGGPLAFGLTIFPGMVWVLYAVSWLPSVGTSVERLKEILIFNSVVVAVTWSVTVVFVPLAFADATLTATGVVLLVYFVLATFVNTEIANAGDVASDQQASVSTMPTVFGVDRTRKYLSVITASVVLILGIATASGVLTALLAVVLSLGVVSLICVTALLGRVDDDQLAIVAECTRLPVFFVLLVLTLAG